MISAQYLPLKVDFYRFYDVMCRDCESIVVHKRCNLLEKKRLLNFKNFLPGELLGSCLGFDLNLSLCP